MRITTFASPRDAVASLAARSGNSLAELSRLLKREPRYLDRFVRDGRPRKLRPDEQQRLADYLGADVRDFGAATARREPAKVHFTA